MSTSTTTPDPVVVGIDGSPSSTRAVRWAALEAARRNTRLSLLHVWTPVPASVPHAAALGAYEDALVAQARQWLADAESVAREAAPDVPTGSSLVEGSAAARLIGRSAAAQLIVLGSRGLGGFTGLVVGSVAVAVATHGHCPVVVVRGDDDEIVRQDGPVVVGVDGSPANRDAVRFAFAAAAARSVPLVAVHAWSDLPLTTSWELTTATDLVQQHAAEELTTWLSAAHAEHPDVTVEPVIAHGGPAQVLLARAGAAQLLVVGSRGRGGFRGLLLGSTSQAMIYHAACPVAVVPSPPH
ncbi:universal stress protein [Promicromonospora thailandica]|uniref:universal stress protein n=1 Tax=Promicromonospora thailandica TaxID=765201 RepID=UPI0020A4ED65|nr:universal stress protein [Promicromonospora thailandica]BFF17529.1 universal stress protein [Promicromonospora thailandica]